MGTTVSKHIGDTYASSDDQNARRPIEPRESSHSPSLGGRLQEHQPIAESDDRQLVVDDGGIHVEDDSADPPYEVSQKGMRIIGAEALFLLPKLALVELFMPADLSVPAELQRGHRASAERVRQHRNPHDIPVATSYCVNRYKALLMRERIQSLALRNSASQSVRPGDLVESSEATESPGDDAICGEFDFLSLSSLAVMDAGIYIRPSWNELAPHVGTVQSIRQLLQQLQEERRKIGEDLQEARERAGDKSENCHTGFFEKRAQHSSDASGDLNSRTKTKPKRPGSKPDALVPSETDSAQCSLVLVQKPQHGEQQWRQQNDNELVGEPVVDILQPRLRRPQELANLQSECSELDEDIHILNRAVGEYSALLRRVWSAERLAEDARIEQMTFRRLWCYPEDDPQQKETADRLFSICFDRERRRSNFIDANSSGGRGDEDPESDRTAGRAGELLGFNELLEQLPPKALECLWCSAELRKKERQSYRYYWI